MDFFEQLYVVPHQDEESLIAFVPLYCRPTDNFADQEEEEAIALVRHTEKTYRYLLEEAESSGEDSTSSSADGRKRIGRFVHCTRGSKKISG